MSTNILYIIDPLKSLDNKTDTTLAIMDEAKKRGLNNFTCELKDIILENSNLSFLCDKKRPSEDFSLIFMRKDPPVDNNYIAATLKLRCFNEKYTQVINHPDGILLANEKLFGLKVAPEFFPDTLVSANIDILLDTACRMKKFVLKPLFRAGGSGVLVLEAKDKNLVSAIELLSDNYKSPIIMQEYIKDAYLGDKRIFLLGGKFLGAILRKPKENEHRSNCHVGGEAFHTGVTKAEMKIVESLKPHLLKNGLHLVGLDVIDNKLTEINVTSPTCIREMEGFTGQNLRSDILDYCLKLVL